MKHIKLFEIFEARRVARLDPNRIDMEEESKKEIICKCGSKWNLDDRDKDPYTCQKCGKIHEKMKWSKFFKIISFKYSFFENDYKIIDDKDPEFNYYIYDCIMSKYNKDKVEINSVKRLLDNEVFTVGDQLLIDGDDYVKIDKIWPSFDQMRADSGRLGIILNRDFITVKK